MDNVNDNCIVETESKHKKTFITLLDSIFYKNTSAYFGIVLNTKEIPELLLLLYKENNPIVLHKMISELICLIQNCPYTAFILSAFTVKLEYSDMTLVKILLDLYLLWAKETNLQDNIDKLLKLLLQNNCIHHSTYDVIYQSLSKKYFLPPIGNRPVLSIEDYWLHQKLLSFLFQYNNDIQDKYIYLTGKDKIVIDVDVPKSKPKPNTPFKLSNGFTAVFWIYHQYSFNELKTIEDMKKNETLIMNIFDLQLLNTRIQLTSVNIHSIGVVINDQLQRGFGSLKILERQLYQLTLKVYNESNNANPCVWLQICDNNKSFACKTNSKKISLEDSISSITFYEDYIGIAKSIICFLDGFPNVTTVLPFDYDAYVLKDYSENSLPIISNTKGHLTQDMISKLMLAYSPFYCTENSRRYSLRDLSLNNLTAKIDLSSSSSSGFSLSCSNQNQLVASISNLLPLFELITMNETMISNDSIIKSFFNLVHNLLLSLPYSVIEINIGHIDDFFSVLGLFMNSIPIKVYTIEFYDYLIEFGKNIFKTYTSFQYKKYFSSVIMTQLISFPNETAMWNNFVQSKNIDNVLSHIGINDLLSLLNEIDILNWKNPCCTNHSHLSEANTNSNSNGNSDNDNNSNLKIIENPSGLDLSPQLQEKTEGILKIIRMKLISTKQRNNIPIVLLSSLLIDHSPCIIKAIVNLFLSFFNQIGDKDIQSETINMLLHSNGIPIILFTFSNATNDIRNDILQLIILLDKKYNKDIKKFIDEFNTNDHYSENIFEFIRENVLMKIPFTPKSQHSSLHEGIVTSNKVDSIEANNTDKLNNEYKLISYKRNNKQLVDKKENNRTNSKPEISYINAKIDTQNCPKKMSHNSENTNTTTHRTSSDYGDINVETIINNSSNLVSIRKESKASSKVSKISKANSNKSSNRTSKDNPRVRAYFSKGNYSDPNQMKMITEVFLSFVGWLTYIINDENDSDTNKEGKIKGIIKCIIKLLIETKKTDFINFFIKTLKVINETNKGPLKSFIVISNMDIYHYLNETAFHSHLLLTVSGFESSLIVNGNKDNDAKSKLAIEIINKEVIDMIHTINKANYSIGETLEPQLKYLNNWSLYNRKLFCATKETEWYTYYLNQYLSMIYQPLIQLLYDTQANDFRYGFTNYLLLFNSLYELTTSHFVSNNNNSKLEPIFISDANPYIIPYLFNKETENKDESKSMISKWPFFNTFLILYNQNNQIWKQTISTTELNVKNETILNDINSLLDKDKLKSMILLVNQRYRHLFFNFQINNQFKNAMPLISIISHFLVVAISLSLSDENENLKWINEYQSFIIFCLLIDFKMTSNKEGGLKEEGSSSTIIQKILSFAIIFLMKNLIKRNESINQSFSIVNPFRDSMTIIFLFLSAINALEVKHGLITKNSFKDILLNKENNNEGDKDKLITKLIFGSKVNEIKSFLVGNSVQLNNSLNSNIVLMQNSNHFFNQKHYKELFNLRNSNRNKIVLYYSNIQNSDTALIIESDSISKKHLLFKDRIEREVIQISGGTLQNIINYPLNTEISIRSRMHLYKKTKKALFSWNGNWSNRSLFFNHPHLLKLKFSNHYTSEYTKPVLVPILDFQSYFPQFSKYNSKNLFQTEHLHNVQLNVGRIFKDDSMNKIFLIKACMKEKENCFRDNDMLLRYNYPSFYNNSSYLNSNVNNKRVPCCLIKISQHIKGFFHLGEDNIEFDNIEWSDDIKPSIIFDKKKNCCFSSFKENEVKYNYMSQKKITYDCISLLIKTRYCYLHCGLQIFTKDHKAFLFKFHCSEDRDSQLSILLNKLQQLVTPFLKIANTDLAYCCNSFPYTSLSDMMTKWENHQISTMEYLMLFNLLSSRSFNDLSQYPIFPWTLNNYSDKPKDESSLRDFGLPIGVIVIEQFKESQRRKDAYIRRYNDRLKEKESLIKTDKYLFGSNYSNHLYVTHYLTRIFPFPQVMLEIQNNSFDNPNRMFISIEASFKCVSTQSGDLRELIPEMFYLPEMFININNLNVGKTTYLGKSEIFNDVTMPSWCNKNPFEFVLELRDNLERVCGVTISNWVDIIFGYKQKGNKARDINNVFMEYAYENNIQLNAIPDYDERMYYFGLYELGIVPSQIITSRAKPRKQYVNVSIFNSNKLTASNINIPFRNDHKAIAMFPIHIGADNEFVIIFDDFAIQTINRTKSNHITNYSIDNTKNNNGVNGFIPIPFKAQFLNVEMSHLKYPIALFNNAFIFIGGFSDGRLLITKLNPSKDINTNSHFVYNNNNNEDNGNNNNAITQIEVDQEDELVICGTANGNIVIYQLTINSLRYYFTLFNHKQKITSLSLNTVLYLMASSSVDGFIYLYSLPSFTIIRAFNINHSYADYVFLSSSPLPCVTYYSSSNSQFHCFSLNGGSIAEVTELNSEDKNRNILVTPYVYKDNYACDYLVYFTLRGVIRIRKFPMMTLKEYAVTKSKKHVRILSITEDKENLFIEE